MKKILIDGESLEGQNVINVVLGECSISNCTGIHLCERCKRLSDIIGNREDVPVGDLVDNVKNVELVRSLI